MRILFGGRRSEAVRAQPPRGQHLGPLTTRRRAGREHGILSLNCGWGLRKLANHEGRSGAGACLLDKYCAVAQRDAGWARTHSATKPRPFESDAPLDESSGY